MKPLKKAETIDCLTTIMDWTTCVSDIKLNAVSLSEVMKIGTAD